MNVSDRSELNVPKTLGELKPIIPSRLAEFGKRWKKSTLSNNGFLTFAKSVKGVCWSTDMTQSPDGNVWCNALLLECKKFSNHFVAVFFPGCKYDPERAVLNLERPIQVLASERLKLHEVDRVFQYLLREYRKFLEKPDKVICKLS